MSYTTLHLTVTEFCFHTGLTAPELHEIVGLGMIEPVNGIQQDWYFDDSAIHVCRRARRLHQELDIEWAGIAVAMSLLDQIDRLNSENRQLSQRLARYTSE